jgi:uncharacterized glyoxalase superfamily protein PhnB
MIGVEIDFGVQDSLVASETYEKVFGAVAVEKTAMVKGSNEVIFTILGSRFRMQDENPEYNLVAPKPEQPNSFWFNLIVENIQIYFDKARSAGFVTLQPIAELKEYGVKNCIQKDPWGYIWMFHQYNKMD